MVLGSAPDAIVIPRRALLGNKVFVVSAGRVKAREVQIGFLGLNKVQIISGLEPGEHVVVENLDMVRTGGRVRVTKYCTMSSNFTIGVRFLLAKRKSMLMSLAGITFGVGFFIVTQAQTSGFEGFL